MPARSSLLSAPLRLSRSLSPRGCARLPLLPRHSALFPTAWRAFPSTFSRSSAAAKRRWRRLVDCVAGDVARRARLARLSRARSFLLVWRPTSALRERRQRHRSGGEGERRATARGRENGETGAGFAEGSTAGVGKKIRDAWEVTERSERAPAGG